jgi:2-polyprenyl-3-methyl-5-hydroxy-6-metoxy-1,4-benzoquinol methylase
MAINSASLACNQCGSTGSTPLFTKHGYQLVKCTECGLAYISNPPSASELERIYSLDANYHADLLNPDSDAFARLKRVAKTHLDVLKTYAKSGRLLDVGCSTGLFLDQARSAGFDVSGLEFSKESAAFARYHFSLAVQDGSVQELVGQAASFDVITMFDVIEHVPDPSADLAAIHGLLKPGGLFFVSTPNIDGLFPKLSYPLANILDYWPHPEPPHHLYQFSCDSMARMLIKSGFAVDDVHHINIDLAYTFGAPGTLLRSPKMLAYALLFAPIAKLGPLLKSGDWFYMVARKS